jgi:hypothetical protein
MGKSEHGGKGDVIGVGGRRIILRLVEQKARTSCKRPST